MRRIQQDYAQSTKADRVSEKTPLPHISRSSVWLWKLSCHCVPRDSLVEFENLVLHKEEQLLLDLRELFW